MERETIVVMSAAAPANGVEKTIELGNGQTHNEPASDPDKTTSR